MMTPNAPHLRTHIITLLVEQYSKLFHSAQLHSNFGYRLPIATSFIPSSSPDTSIAVSKQKSTLSAYRNSSIGTKEQTLDLLFSKPRKNKRQWQPHLGDWLADGPRRLPGGRWDSNSSVASASYRSACGVHGGLHERGTPVHLRPDGTHVSSGDISSIPRSRGPTGEWELSIFSSKERWCLKGRSSSGGEERLEGRERRRSI